MPSERAKIVTRLLDAYKTVVADLADVQRKLAEAMQQPPVTDPTELKEQQERAEQAEAKVAELEALIAQRDAEDDALDDEIEAVLPN